MNNAEITVILPVYRPSEQLNRYVEGLLAVGIGRVVVADGGSGEEYAHIFAGLETLPSCKVIRSDGDCGRGRALKAAFGYCRESINCGVFVTADYDGGYAPDDILTVAAQASEYPGELVLGARVSCDKKSKSRRRGTAVRILFKLLYGMDLSDPMTGLRGFSHTLLDRLISIRGARYEYEITQLILLHKRGIAIREVPVSNVHTADWVSHFRPLADGIRVFGAMMLNLGLYLFSSLSATAADQLIFYFIIKYVDLFGGRMWLSTLVATVTARVFSSALNLFINYKLVFNGRTKRSICRYYTLWVAQLTVAYGCNYIWKSLFASELVVTAMKTASDFVLSLISYQVQCNWVFADMRRSTSFFTFKERMARLLRRKPRSMVLSDPDGAIYIVKAQTYRQKLDVALGLGFDTHMIAEDMPSGLKAIDPNANDATECVLRCLGMRQSILMFTEGIEITPMLCDICDACVERYGSAPNVVPLVLDVQRHFICEYPPVKYDDTEAMLRFVNRSI